MRKFIVSLAVAASALAVASPAAAQYYPQYGQGYGYNGGYQGYGYRHNNRAQMRDELRQIRFEADQLGRQGRLTRSEARDLFNDIHSAERALYRSSNPWQLGQKIARIRRELHIYSDYDGRSRYGRRGYGNGDYDRDYGRDYDRDRDGRDDRYENDQGWDRDD